MISKFLRSFSDRWESQYITRTEKKFSVLNTRKRKRSFILLLDSGVSRSQISELQKHNLSGYANMKYIVKKEMT